MTSASVSRLLVAPRAPHACPPSTLYKDRSITLRRGSLSCRAASCGDRNLDRRDVLAGLMGITAGGLGASNPNFAAAAADATTDVLACKGSDVTDRLLHCIPSNPNDPSDRAPCPQPAPPDTVVDFTLSSPLRVRKPAHLADQELVEKYRLAVTKMKQLEESDPRSFVSQARIHEAYCDAHYKLSTATGGGGGGDEKFDVHFSWIFAPWHRMYIYFYERILGNLIGDDTFALPYWNWDEPAGMVLPAMFSEGDPKSNSLYDCNRNMDHVDKYVVLDYVYDSGKKAIPFDPENPNAMNDIVRDNLSLIYHQMIRGGKGARCFHGEKFCTDDEPGLHKGTSGTMDRMAHSGVHIFLGDKKKCYDGPHHKDCGMDMGFLGTAAYDPVFYTHHANVDRMWHLWAHEIPGHKDFKDPKWLDTSFVFYDENKRPVRIRVRDVLDVEGLGYRFEDHGEKKWMHCRPTLSQNKSLWSAASVSRCLPPPPEPAFPLTLERGQSVVVLAVDRPSKVKDKPLSLLFKQSIQFHPSRACKFDVAINVPLDQANNVGPQWVEYAGTFFTLARSFPSVVPGGGGMKPIPLPPFARTSLELPLEDVLDDIPVKEGAPIYVVLVPRTSGVTILDKPTIMPTVCDEEYPEQDKA